MKVLVAGASGFVGQRLCVALDQAGRNVVARGGGYIPLCLNFALRHNGR